MKFGWPQVCSLFFQSLCFMGFSYQAINFTCEYFRYATDSDLSIRTPVQVSVPDFTVCFRYVDVLDYDLLAKVKPNFTAKAIDKLRPDEDVEEAITKVQKLVTIEDILLSTPPIDVILSRCSTKRPKDIEFEDIELEECNKQFVIWKFYLQEYICYRFKKVVTAETRDFQYRLISYAIDRPGTLYTLKTNNTRLMQTRYLKAVIHASNKNPEASLAMTTNIKRRFDDESLGEKDDIRKNYYLFSMTYSDLIMLRKEPPYDTGCRDYSTTSTSLQSAIDCRTDCLVNRTIQGLHKVPFSASLWNFTSIIQYMVGHGDTSEKTESLLQEYSAKEQVLMRILKYQHLTNQDLLNRSISNTMMQIEGECLHECRQPDCEDSVTLTKGSYDYIREEDLNREEDQFLEFEVSVPKNPEIAITYKEAMTWSEFLIYLLSCFGIWFGLSVLSVNPFKLSVKSLGQASGAKDFCMQIRASTRKCIRSEVEAIARQIGSKSLHSRTRR